MGSRIEGRVGKLEAKAGDPDEPIRVFCFDDGRGGPIEGNVAGRKVDCHDLPPGFAPYWVVFVRDGEVAE